MSLRDQLTSVYLEHGKLTPALLVDEARPPDSPLHPRFEWDDSVAAESFRRSQAADLIRSVKVVYKDNDDGTQESVRAFVSVRPAEKDVDASYRPIEEVAADPFAMRVLLRECRREWSAFKSKYERLVEFDAIVNGSEVEQAG